MSRQKAPPLHQSGLEQAKQPKPILAAAIAVLILILLSVALSGCQVLGVGSPDATSTPTPAPTVPPTATTAASNQTGNQTAAKQWSSPPAMTIDVNKTYELVMHTNMGDFTITLLPKEAPLAANNFLFLASQHFYDGVKFHRIVAGFMIQGGDPTGTGTGGPGYGFAIETPKNEDYVKGIVAMANTGQPDSNGSQFFIMLGDYSGGKLPKNYSIFGKVTSGMAVVDKIGAVPTAANPNMNGEQSLPLKDVRIISTEVKE
jgi:cyclophilin family peptidyl-prolyl cis-trans isomerase